MWNKCLSSRQFRRDGFESRPESKEAPQMKCFLYLAVCRGFAIDRPVGIKSLVLVVIFRL